MRKLLCKTNEGKKLVIFEEKNYYRLPVELADRRNILDNHFISLDEIGMLLGVSLEIEQII